MRSFLAAAVLAAVAVVLTGCGGATASGPQPSRPTLPHEPGILVTRADDHAIVRARVGDQIRIALGTEFEWRLQPPDGAVLRSSVQNASLAQGTQASWTAASAGTSVVTATGTVICPSGRACIMVAVLFTATVIVDP